MQYCITKAALEYVEVDKWYHKGLISWHSYFKSKSTKNQPIFHLGGGPKVKSVQGLRKLLLNQPWNVSLNCQSDFSDSNQQHCNIMNICLDGAVKLSTKDMRLQFSYLTYTLPYSV